MGAGAVVLITLVALVATAAAVVGHAAGAFASVEGSDVPETVESRVELTGVPTEADGAVAVAKSMHGARGIIGFTIRPATRAVTVQFAAPPRCAASVDVGDDWPDVTGGCVDDRALSGTVSAVTGTADDQLVVEVDMPVEPLCYVNVVLGEPYTDDISGCG